MKKALILVALLAALAIPTFSQNSFYSDHALRYNAGFPAYPASGAVITVCQFSAIGLPCTPLAPICSSPTDLTCASPNPFNADANGNFGFWAPPGLYIVTITGANLNGYSLIVSQDVPINGTGITLGALTVNGPLNSNNLAAGNVANKPATADAVRFVTVSGNDTNDGLSWGTAKATIGAAYSALPTCTPYPSYNFGGALVSFSAPCGVIYIGAHSVSPSDGYSISSPVIINSAMVRIVGTDKLGTTIQCGTTSPCIQMLMGNSVGAGHGGGTVNYGPSPVMSSRGGLENLSITGSSAANQIGFQCNDCTGAVLKDLRISNFSGTGAMGAYLLNDLDGITERLEMDNVAFENDTNQVVLDAPNALLASFQHNQWHHVQFSLGNGQTGVTLKNNAQLSGYIDGVLNMCLGSCTAFSILNSALANVFNGLLYDGAGTLTLCNGCTASNSRFIGPGGAPIQTYANNGTTSFKDTQLVFNCTVGATACGTAYYLTGIAQGILAIDGSGFLNYNTPSGTRVAGLSNAAGGGIWLYGSVSGAYNLQPNSTGTALSNVAIANVINQTGLQLFNTNTTCTTAATINTPCTTTAITLPVGYSDTNYRLGCSGLSHTNFPQILDYTKSNTTFTITLNNLTAAAATYTSFDCWAVHN